VVPPDTVFVMGDVRDNSDDSRFHPENGRSGAIPRSKVDGVVVGQGSVFSLQTLNPTTAFVDAGLPGVSSADSTYGNARWFVAGGVALFLLGVTGVIVSAVRTAGRRRRAAAIPPMH
jgi:signal peptidase I